MRVLLATCVLVGCKSGIFIEVRPADGGPETTHVDLIVATKCSKLLEDCPAGMAPAGIKFPVDGEIFIHDGIVLTEPIEDGSAWFELRGAGTLDMVIAVGTSGGAARADVTGVAVMRQQIDLDAGTRHYLAQLDPVEPLAQNDDPVRAGVIAWGGPELRCLGVDPVQPAGMLFVVPPDDFDCDGLVGECAEFAHLGSVLSSDRHCVLDSTKIAPGNPSPPCVVGHQFECHDIIDANTPVCGENTQICVPDSLCRLGDPLNDIRLAQELLVMPDSRVVCSLGGTPSMDDPNKLVPCPGSLPVTIPLHDPSLECTDLPRFASVEAPFELDVDSVTLDEATFAFQSIDQQCKIEAVWDGAIDPMVGGLATVMKVFVKTPNGIRRELLVPITFEMRTDCGKPDQCALDTIGNPDPMYHCGD